MQRPTHFLQLLSHRQPQATGITEYLLRLQAGSFKVKADAERMRAQLILQGLPNVHTDTSKNKDGTLWYRVRLGPFDNRSKLSKAYDKLVQLNIQPLRIKQ